MAKNKNSKKEKSPKPAKAGFLAVIWDWASTIGIAFLLAIIIRAFIIQAYFIPSGSMIPTLEIKDRLLVSKLAYGLQNPLNGLSEYQTFMNVIPNPVYRMNLPLSGIKYFLKFPRNPHRFSIVIFRSPQGWGKDLIKRVVALPGETVVLRKGVIYINGAPVKETHKMNPDQAEFGPVVVPDNSYFVMGDNRPDSNDSRYWGFLPADNILGEALVIFWPLNRLALIK